MKHWMLVAGLCVAQMAVAAPSRPEFHRAVIALHAQQIARHTIRIEETNGAYLGSAAAGYHYRITSYYDAGTGRLLSRIQRDAKVPEAVHIAEVNIYDAEGKLIRDYSSSAPPWNPTYPSHAYINLHHYHGRLHSFRQYELEGQVNYVFCEGELEGKPVRIARDWDDVTAQIKASPEYRACFDGMSGDWAQFTTPH